MANPTSPNGDKDNPATSSAQAELLQTVLASEQYPWLPNTNRSTDGADPLEAAGLTMEISDEDARQGWNALSAQLTQMWGESAPQSTLASAPLQAALMEKFSGRLPATIIEQIGTKAKQLASDGQASGQTILDQMVMCVEDVMGTMAAADLQVFGRPMALAMRSTSSDEILEATIQSIRSVEWEALSPIEQAKLSLAVARYAISEAEK
ncbi:MAG: hypothetical protein AAGJ69_05925 [Cyanobacteria bacterium J06559_1]